MAASVRAAPGSAAAASTSHRCGRVVTGSILERDAEERALEIAQAEQQARG